MSYILRQTSVGSLHNNQVNPTSPPQHQQNRPPSRPPSRPPLKLYVSAAGRMPASPPPSAMSPFPLTPLIAEVEQEKLAGNNLSDLVKGQCLTLLLVDNLAPTRFEYVAFSAANESAMLQLQAFKHPEPNTHFSSPPPRRRATAIASTSNTDAIEPAPESLR